MSERFPHQTPEMLQTHQAMLDAGYVAVGGTPGGYVPGPDMPKTDWLVPREDVIALFEPYCDECEDPQAVRELLAELT